MTTTPADDVQAIDELVSSIRQRLIDRRANISGLNIARLAETMVQSVPVPDTPNTLTEATGPFYNTAGLVRWLGISRQALKQRAEKHRILACKTSDGHLLYPVWQFTAAGEQLPGLPATLTILAAGMDSPWTWAQWLQGSTPDRLDGKAPAEWLAVGGNPQTIHDLARQDAAVWSA